MNAGSSSFDQLAPDYGTIVVGGGLGGLLAAAAASRSGATVLVVERLPYLGGRFTTVEQEGWEITTGALHLVPHGLGGPLARLLGELGVGYHGVPREVYASFHLQGRHVVWRRRRDVLQLAGPTVVVDFLRVLAQLTITARARPDELFSDWLARHTTNPLTMRLYERFVEFGLSVRTNQISCADLSAVVARIIHDGLPAAPSGGCKRVVDDLAGFVQARGGTIRRYTEALALVRNERGRVAGVQVRDRATGATRVLAADQVVSDAGPRATAALLDRADAVFPESIPVGRGLKLHLASDRSLIPHNGIMFCLDTKRISGIVQVSNAVPSVAPPGRFMLDTFQVLQSDDVALERRLAVEDLRQVFGPDYDRHCRVVRASAFRGSWPVNRVAHGHPAPSQTPLPGLVMVGDAYKAPGDHDGRRGGE